MAATATRKSATGYYRVELTQKFEDQEFVYRPSHDLIRVDEGLLGRMKAAGVVGNVEPE